MRVETGGGDAEAQGHGGALPTPRSRRSPGSPKPLRAQSYIALPSESKRHPTLAPTSSCNEKGPRTYGGNILLYRLHNLHPQGSDRFAYTDL